MINRFIPVILFMLNLQFLQNASGQGQMNIPDYINNRFKSYIKSVPREEVFVHTDKELYISGEEMWINIYLIDRQSFKLSAHSDIVYFELLNAENRPVVQKKVLVNNGLGPGQVILPDTLGSGIYLIRAYTNWMKNFFPSNCFSKDISIYNPLRSKPFRIVNRSKGIKENVTGTLNNQRISLNVNNLRKDSLEIFIRTDEQFRSENRNLICLLIQTRGTINHLSPEKITQDITRITFPKSSLPGGINQIALFDSKGPVCDRFIYSPVKDKPLISVNTDENYGKRSKVTFAVGYELSEISDLTNLSISVSAVADGQETTDLNDYLVLGTEFELFPWHGIKERKITSLSPELIDSLLLNVRSNWINWKTIFSNDVQQFSYPAEKEYHYVSGRLLTNKLQPASAGEIILMSTPGKEAVFQYARTDREGNFRFRVHTDDDIKDLILQPDADQRNQKVYTESSFLNQYMPQEVYPDSASRPITPFISRQCTNYLVRKIFGFSSVGNTITPVIQHLKSKRFYGKPDFELIMKDYVKLDSMQEVFFELVPHFDFIRNNSDYEMTVTDAFRNKLDGNPCIMIDGVIIKDLSIIAKLNPELVEKIDVIWEKQRVGEYIFNGIVNILTKTSEFSNDILPADIVRLHYKAFDPVCLFESPDYSSADAKSSPVADFRSTLYWNPSVILDKDGKATIGFWSGDIKTDYIINIQGISTEGRVVSFRKIFKVN